MADLSQLERALINADKAGDVEGAKVLAGEIRRLRSSNNSVDPTVGMSVGEKLLAGVGKGMVDLTRGAGQLLGLVDQSEIDEAKRLDAPLMNTTSGKIGNVAGNIAVGLPAMFVPGANTLVGSALIGGGMGALQPVASDESRLVNTGTSAAFGLGGQVAGRALGAAAKGGKALVEPFYESGQEQIAARTLRAFAGDPAKAAAKLSTAKPLVHGSLPTTAEVAQDAGIAQLQRGLQTQSPQLADDLAQRALDQNSARLAAMHELTKYGSSLDDAMARRGEAGSKLYEKAFGQQIRVDESIKTLTQRPSFQLALERAQRIASEEGNPIKNLFDQQGKFASVKALHYVKMGFDDLINDSAQSGIGKAELNAIKGTRGKLLDWISDNNPAYNTARVRFEKMSRPINREEVAREITNRATRNQLPNVRGESTIYPDAFARTLKDEGSAVVKAVTGREGKALDSVMTPNQLQALSDIRGDLSRTVTARDFGRSVGSNTAQNLASQNLLRQVLGPTGLPKSWAENTLLKTAVRPYQFAAELGEPNIQGLLGEAMLDPEYAAMLLRMAEPSGGRISGLLGRSPQAFGLLGPSIYAGQE